MRRLAQLALFAIGVVPAAVDAQDLKLPVTCAFADSVLGPPSPAQRRASLVRSRAPDGTVYVQTGTRMLSASGLSIHLSWPRGGVGEQVAAQLMATPRTADAMRLLGSGDTVVLIIDDGMPVPLGVPTPATIASDRLPPRLPVMVRMFEEELRAVAVANAVVVRYGDLRIPFDKSDLATSNALYRMLRCARAAAATGDPR